ncbi:MAG: GNAT family N-acetyltransferase [Kiloniellaceae bacterium]
MAERMALHLETGRLAIRPLDPDDEAAYCRFASEGPVAARMVGAFGPNGELRFVSTLDGAEKAAMFRGHLANRIGGVPSRYAVVLRDGGGFVGAIGSYEIDPARIGLSYWIAVDHHGKGFAQEVLRAYCGPALRLFGRRLMLANVEPDNAASLAALRKVGFTDFDPAASPAVQVPADRVFLQFDGTGAGG